MPAVIVRLAPAQMALAGRIGGERTERNRHRNRWGCLDAPTADRIGAAGELAVAVHTGLPWEGSFRDPEERRAWVAVGYDVGPFQVRATTWPHGRLFCHKADRDQDIFILARVLLGYRPVRVALPGWNYGWAVKKPEYWKPGDRGRPCFYLPNHLLLPLASLPLAVSPGRG
jgi:hypothetical protein